MKLNTFADILDAQIPTLEIDPDAIDVAWLEQANLFRNASDAAADALEQELDAKDEVERVDAELTNAIKEKPQKFGFEGKPTEKDVRAAVVLDPEYIAAQKMQSQARAIRVKLEGRVQAFEHRKRSLENLVELHTRQYFAGPKEPRDLKREWDSDARAARRERTTSTMRERMNTTPSAGKARRASRRSGSK